MQSRRDHVQAYRFSIGRLISAVVTGDPGNGESPTRRADLGAMIGLAVTALLIGGAAVYGLISPGANKSWRKPGSLIVEKETGTRYLFLDGVLRPTRNYASALLATGANPTVHSVPRDALRDVRRGAPIGIPDAPDSVPAPSELLHGAWNLCLGGRDEEAQQIDLAPGPDTALGGDRRILLADPDGAKYVLWKDTKYPVGDFSALVALGLGDREPMKAPAAWLAALPTGTALAPADIPRAGKPGPRVGGRPAKVGQLFRTGQAGASQNLVLRSDGLAPLTRTEAALLQARPGHPAPVEVTTADVAAARGSHDRTLLSRIPDLLSVAEWRGDRDRLCVRQKAAGTKVEATVVVRDGAVSPGAGVRVPPGRGMLVAELAPRPGEQMPRRYLITDQGRKYPLSDDATANALGYGRVAPLPVPRKVLDAVPSGPALVASSRGKGGQ
ncbi:type VII secretion protein EccB [Streptomyces bugieae]|uniref:Type VII secretion protein EccB n=1 Tax=Streptomyces bugieae TaxID=3098223 RepID=A0ABU7NJ30_9ACTN|nr:type VII secretion protein EccB [Streptomyces sp. DSM 41528]